jgi:acyl-CoA synthetase (AMP-forming)/AMP-acid ligase II
MIVRSPFPDVSIPEISLTTLVLQRAAELKDKPAMIDGPSGRTLTFGQLAGAVKLAAAGLAHKGLHKGDVFAIYSPNLPEYFIAFHAVASLGGINTTVNPLYTVHELTNQLKDSNAQYLLTIPHFIGPALEAAKAANIREVFVFGEAEGATPFATLLQNDGQLPPQRRSDCAALFEWHDRASQRCNAHPLQPGCQYYAEHGRNPGSD